MASVTIRITPASHKMLKALSKLDGRTMASQLWQILRTEADRRKLPYEKAASHRRG